MEAEGMLPASIPVGVISKRYQEEDIIKWLKDKLAERVGCNMNYVESMPWPPVFMLSTEVAELLHLSATTVVKRSKDGFLPQLITFKVESKFVKSEIEDFLIKRLRSRDGYEDVEIQLPLEFYNTKQVSKIISGTIKEHIAEYLRKKGILKGEISILPGGKRLYLKSEIDANKETIIALWKSYRKSVGEKISSANKGKKYTPEALKRMSEGQKRRWSNLDIRPPSPLKGRKASPETCQKISEAAKARYADKKGLVAGCAS